MPTTLSSLNLTGVQFKEGAAPSNPAAGYGRAYVDAGGVLRYVSDTPIDLPLHNPGSLDVVTADTEVVNTAAETTLWTYTLPANYLGADGLLRYNGFISYLNNSGANRTFILRFKYGATTLLTLTTAALATSATRRWMDLWAYLKGDAATNAQRASWFPGLLGLMAANAQHNGDEGTSAEDSTTALALTLTIQHSLAAATISAIIRHSTLELLKAV